MARGKKSLGGSGKTLDPRKVAARPTKGGLGEPSGFTAGKGKKK